MQPFKGVRVLDFATLLTGPVAALILGAANHLTDDGV